MRETRPHVIDGFTYSIQQLGAKEGRIVLARILRIVGGAIAAGAAGGEGESNVTAAVGKLVESLPDAEVNFLCDTFAKGTQVSAEDTPDKVVLMKDVFDDHFAGRYGAMVKWLMAALETNFGSFLDGLGLDVEALKEKAKAAMSGSPASPTPPSGASSSPASAA